jgi:hypothetical protein
MEAITMTKKPDFIVARGGGEVEWKLLHPKMTLEHLGYIPGWLRGEDPRSAREQIDAGYLFGGFQPFEGFRLEADNSLSYSGDPPIRPLAEARFRDELVVFYPHSWVAIIQPDRSFAVARID